MPYFGIVLKVDISCGDSNLSQCRECWRLVRAGTRQPRLQSIVNKLVSYYECTDKNRSTISVLTSNPWVQLLVLSFIVLLNHTQNLTSRILMSRLFVLLIHLITTSSYWRELFYFLRTTIFSFWITTLYAFVNQDQTDFNYYQRLIYVESWL